MRLKSWSVKMYSALSLIEKYDKSYAEIDQELCVGCTVCVWVCKFEAISK